LANLAVIRRLMERSCQYELISAQAGVGAGLAAAVGSAGLFAIGDRDPSYFGLVWGIVFVAALLWFCVCTFWRGRSRNEPVWSSQAAAVLGAIAPSVIAAAMLTVFFLGRLDHRWLPGVWMICYAQAALATAAYAPAPIRWMGYWFFAASALTLALGVEMSNIMMAVAFGGGHWMLGACLLMRERESGRLKIYHPA
jgi:hypothetical protein